jgi:hypothetical protein
MEFNCDNYGANGYITPKKGPRVWHIPSIEVIHRDAKLKRKIEAKKIFLSKESNKFNRCLSYVYNEDGLEESKHYDC